MQCRPIHGVKLQIQKGECYEQNYRIRDAVSKPTNQHKPKPWVPEHCLSFDAVFTYQLGVRRLAIEPKV